jgi:hypothetical protein
MKDKIMDLERLILEDIQFNVDLQPPHRFALSVLKSFDGDREVANVCWNTLNNSYSSTVCIQFPFHCISVSCVLIAYKELRLELPDQILDKKWLNERFLTKDQVIECSLEITSAFMQMAKNDARRMQVGKVRHELKLMAPQPLKVLTKCI